MLHPCPGAGFSRFALAAVLLVPVTGSADAPRRSRAVDVLAQRLRSLAEEESIESARSLEELVDAGLPPGASVVLLEALARHPRPELAGLLRELSLYRRPAVRGRAFAARVALGGPEALAALEQASTDIDRGVRRLALVLARREAGPEFERIAARLLSTEPDLDVVALAEQGT